MSVGLDLRLLRAPARSPMAANDPETLTIAQVAQRIGISEAGVYARVRRGIFPAPTRRGRWSADEVTAHLRGGSR